MAYSRGSIFASDGRRRPMSKVLNTFTRNLRIHHMLVIEGATLAIAAAAFGISRMRCQQIACAVAKTRTLTEARAKHSKGEVSCA